MVLALRRNIFATLSVLLLVVATTETFFSNAVSVQRRDGDSNGLTSLVGRLVLQCDMADDVHPGASNNETFYLEPLNPQERDEVMKVKSSEDFTFVDGRVYINVVPAGSHVASIVAVTVPTDQIVGRSRRSEFPEQVSAVSKVSSVSKMSKIPVAPHKLARRNRRQLNPGDSHEIIFLHITVEVAGASVSLSNPDDDISDWRSYYEDVSFGNIKIPTEAELIPVTTSVTASQQTSNDYCYDVHVNEGFHMQQWLKMSTTLLRSDEYCTSARTIYYYNVVSTPEECAFHCMEYEENCKFFRYNPGTRYCIGYRTDGFEFQSDCTAWKSSNGDNFYRIDFGNNPQISISKFNEWYHNDDGIFRVVVYLLPDSLDVTLNPSNDCNLCGRASLGGQTTTVYLDGDVSKSCIFHELGHTLGASHAKAVFDNDLHPNFEGTSGYKTYTKEGQGWSDTFYSSHSNFYEYGDYSSIMGTGTHTDGIGFNAAFVGLLGWLEDDEWEQNWQRPQASHSDCKQRIVLGALNRPRDRGEDFCPTKMITFLRGTYNGEKTYYHLSYRSTDEATRDARLGAPFGDAVFVHFTLGELEYSSVFDGSYLVGVVGPDNEFQSTATTPGPNFRVSMVGDRPSCYEKAIGAGGGGSDTVNRNEVIVEVDFCSPNTWPEPEAPSTSYDYIRIATGKYCAGSWYTFFVDGKNMEERADQCAEITWRRRENSCTAGATDEFYGIFAVVTVGGDHQCRVYVKSSGGGNSCKTCSTITYNGGQAFAYALDTDICFDGTYPQVSDPPPLNGDDGICLVEDFFEAPTTTPEPTPEPEPCPTCHRRRARRDL